jgi:hypothetical protein
MSKISSQNESKWSAFVGGKHTDGKRQVNHRRAAIRSAGHFQPVIEAEMDDPE